MTDTKKPHRLVHLDDSAADLFERYHLDVKMDDFHTDETYEITSGPRLLTKEEYEKLISSPIDLVLKKKREEYIEEYVGRFEISWRRLSDGGLLIEDVKEPVRPPAFGEWIIALLVRKKGRADAILGDLEERFARDLLKRGERRAHWLYYAGVLKSIAPLLWSTIKKLGIFAAVADVARRYLGG